MSNNENYKKLLSLILLGVIGNCDLIEKYINGFLFFWLEQRIYGLIQAVIISYTSLKEDLLPFGYSPAPVTTGTW